MKSDVEVVSRPESLFMSERRNFLVFKTYVHGNYFDYVPAVPKKAHFRKRILIKYVG